MTVDDPNIRKAEEADFLAIARVWHASWHVSEGLLCPAAAQGRNPAWFEGRAGTNATRMFVAQIQSEIVGFVGWEEDGIDQLFVLPDYFGCGIAQRLLNVAEDVLRSEGHLKIWLHCVKGNDRASRFYEKQGWRVVHEFDAEMKTNTAPVLARALHMEKDL